MARQAFAASVAATALMLALPITPSAADDREPATSEEPGPTTTSAEVEVEEIAPPPVAPTPVAPTPVAPPPVAPPHVGSDEQPVGSDEQPVGSDEQPVGSDEQPVDSDDEQPVDSDEKPVDSDEKPVESDEAPEDEGASRELFREGASATGAASSADAPPDPGVGEDDSASTAGIAASTEDVESEPAAPTAASTADPPTGSGSPAEIAILPAGPTVATSDFATAPILEAAPQLVIPLAGVEALTGGLGEADIGALQANLKVGSRGLGIPLVLLIGIGVFLVVEGRTGAHGPKLAEAPRRSRGAARFPKPSS